MSDQSRRKLLKSIAAGSGAVVVGKSLPESWSRPVVDSVILPAHAQTSQLVEVSFLESQDLPDDFWFATGTRDFIFDVTGIIPTSVGTITVNAIADLDTTNEFISIEIDGNTLGDIHVNGSNQCPATPDTDSISVPIATLEAAASDGSITISLIPSDQMHNTCSTSGTVELSFTGLAPAP
jgi:hypothetical protein